MSSSLTSKDLPMMHTPCKMCPFRKDCLKGWLGKKRMTQILNADSFVCHKTTDGDRLDRKQCAGFMLLKENGSTFVATAKALGIPIDLKGRELVFDTVEDCINHHK